MITNDSGHLRVTVSPTGVKVEYVRAVLPADETPELTNGAVSMVYTIPNMGSMGDGILILGLSCRADLGAAGEWFADKQSLEAPV